MQEEKNGSNTRQALHGEAQWGNLRTENSIEKVSQVMPEDLGLMGLHEHWKLNRSFRKEPHIREKLPGILP